ncbi:proclotting enzyme [Nephila pilipes]|uniref:Proclotting enzyme n=1 Tax=Nephila pilipes TaxID=299642 RepID=A0A8X6NZ20_NEPPI|nr:proclotting enzyme [Nephila pilipes]
MSPVQRRSNKISSISPNECGVRREDTEANADISRKVQTKDGELITLSGRFVAGGIKVTERWPWMAAIFDEDKEKQLCGGTVIDSTHIVTASHCFDDKSLNSDLYTVQVGEISLVGNNTTHKVQEIKIHENYRPGYYYNDIAVIKLSESLSNDAIPICLPEEEMVLPGDNVTVLGWGDLAYRKSSSAEHSNLKYNNFFIASAAGGDSGGPLLREYSEKKFALVGIVSFGVKCAEPGFPGVYTKVSAHIPWIARYIGAQTNQTNSRSNDRPNTGRIIFRNE